MQLGHVDIQPILLEEMSTDSFISLMQFSCSRSTFILTPREQDKQIPNTAFSLAKSEPLIYSLQTLFSPSNRSFKTQQTYIFVLSMPF